MSHRVRRMLSGLAATLAIAGSLVAGTATPAAAIGGETFGCRVAPGTEFQFYPFCVNRGAATTYYVAFVVDNLSGGGYSFQWNLSGPYTSIYSGCTSTSSGCTVTAPGGSFDTQLYANVVVTQNGQSVSLNSTAYLRAYCGGQLC